MLDVLTWHVHGSYLLSLAAVPVRWWLPTAPDRFGYGGRGATFRWPSNVVEVPIEEVPDLDVDAVVYQHRSHYEHDRFDVLGDRQRAAPALFIEHDPPREVPTDTRHPVDDGRTVVVHVTHFNHLMWDTRNPSVVVEHGVAVPGRLGSLERRAGITVINDLRERGRRLGHDVFEHVRRQVPVDLIGSGAAELGGRGEVAPHEVVDTVSAYRFLFSPIRYTSLGLGILEAMAAGVPVVGLATTELATVIRNGHDGFVHTDVDRIVTDARRLLDDRDLALELGAQARATVCDRFSLDRFVADWTRLLERVAHG
jgi:hypothetical protein